MGMRLSGLMSGMDTESIISQLVEARKTKVTTAVKAQKSLKYKQDAWKSLNTQIVSLYSKSLSNMRFESTFMKKTTKVSNSNAVSVITGEGAMNSVQSLEIKQMAKTGYMTGGKLTAYTKDENGKDVETAVTGKTTLGELGFSGTEEILVEIGGDAETRTPIKVDATTTISSFVGALRTAGLNANFDEANGRIHVSSKTSGEGNDFTLKARYGGMSAALNSLKLDYDDAYAKHKKDYEDELAGAVTSADKEAVRQKYADRLKFDEKGDVIGLASGCTRTNGQDAKITLNGAEYTSSSNTFKVNGLTLSVNAVTAPGETITLTTEDDTDGIYDMIKNFFKEYNGLINQMDKLYNADSAKGYEPLTDEEKEAMSDSQIEEWESKIKDSILRKDASLGSIANTMKTIMMQGVEVNGKTMYLSNFGIGTLSYFSAPENEKNAYHIDGDSDDGETSGNADKLKTMISNDPDTVVAFFTGLATNLYDEMSKTMASTEYSSFNSAYDDKKMQIEYDDYTVKIKELEDKLADYEDKWYAKFAAMETALAKMQNNASAVTALLGG